MRLATRRREREGYAGDLLPVAALAEDGLLVRSDGALVRYLEVLPRNPLVLDADGAERLTGGFAAVLARLPAGQALQLYVEARPLALDAVLTQFADIAERALVAREGELRGSAVESLARLGEVHAESLKVHAGEHAAVSVRHVVVIPYCAERRRGAVQRRHARARGVAGWRRRTITRGWHANRWRCPTACARSSRRRTARGGCSTDARSPRC